MVLVVSHRSKQFSQIHLKPPQAWGQIGLKLHLKGWNNPRKTHFFSAIYRGQGGETTLFTAVFFWKTVGQLILLLIGVDNLFFAKQIYQTSDLTEGTDGKGVQKITPNLRRK